MPALARVLRDDELEAELGKVIMKRVRAHRRREKFWRWVRFLREVFWG